MRHKWLTVSPNVVECEKCGLRVEVGTMKRGAGKCLGNLYSQQLKSYINGMREDRKEDKL